MSNKWSIVIVSGCGWMSRALPGAMNKRIIYRVPGTKLVNLSLKR